MKVEGTINKGRRRTILQELPPGADDGLVKEASVEVTNPSHYAQAIFIEPIDAIWGVGFNFGSAYKYLQRLGLKGGGNTSARDAKAGTWYGCDLVARQFAMLDGEYVPTFVELADFDGTAFVDNVLVHANVFEAELGLPYTGESHKRFVLAALHRQIRISEDAVFTGMSDHAMREFVLENAATVSILRDYVASAIGHEMASIASIYKGATSFEMTETLYAQMESATKLLLDASGLLLVARGRWWGQEIKFNAGPGEF